MRLWTLQPLEYFNACKDKGVIKADPDFMESLDEGWGFKAPYEWMIRQLNKRIPGYDGGYPVWCYPYKPDMRLSCWGRDGSKEVRIEFEVPDEKVLISDYQLWHIPLNNGYLGTSEQDDDAFDAEEIARGCASKHLVNSKWYETDDPYPNDLRQKIFDSWERIFPDRWHELNDPDWFGTVGDDLQVCVQEVPFSSIIKTSVHTLRSPKY